MPKFYIHRLYAAYVTDVREIEAADEEEAQELASNGNGEYIGSHIGDYIDWVMDGSVDEIFPAEPANLPLGILYYPTEDK